MKKRFFLSLIVSMIFLLPFSGSSGATTIPQDLQHAFDSLTLIEAPIFAPEAYEKAEKKFNKVREEIARGTKQSKVDKYIDETRELTENVFKVTEFAKLTLSDYLMVRENALKVQAPTRVPELYQKAEEQFVKATKKVEKGDADQGLKEAERARPLFDEAELKAIKVEVMGEASKLVEKADKDEASNFAPVSLDRARTALTKCDNLLSADRYNRNETVEYAATAAYEARHASNITQSIRSMERNDQAWEKLMLLYELEMQKVGEKLGIELLQFDRGPGPASEEIMLSLEALFVTFETQQNINAQIAGQLADIATQLEMEINVKDPLELAAAINEAVGDVLLKRDILKSELDSKKNKLDELADVHEQVSAQLHDRVAIEEKMNTARDIINPTEGEILFNATNDIVLRLSALSFASGTDEITENHVPFLNKVEKVLGMFPDNRLMVEGHTDDLGERSANMMLSEKRAFAVMQYLRRSMSISADRISAVGYGPDKPIGTNTTKEGRAKNRRIDIIIFQ